MDRRGFFSSLVGTAVVGTTSTIGLASGKNEDNSTDYKLEVGKFSDYDPMPDEYKLGDYIESDTERVVEAFRDGRGTYTMYQNEIKEIEKDKIMVGRRTGRVRMIFEFVTPGYPWS